LEKVEEGEEDKIEDLCLLLKEIENLSETKEEFNKLC